MINRRYLWPSDKPLVVLECGWQNKLDTGHHLEHDRGVRFVMKKEGGKCPIFNPFLNVSPFRVRARAPKVTDFQVYIRYM